uniref:Putative cadherin n=1 Tax=Schistosoma mansoni TaxID=6183 RepID=A0A3Q0KLT1_SCHMA
MILAPDKVEKQFNQQIGQRYKSKLLCTITITKKRTCQTRKTNLISNKKISHSRLFLCQLFSVFILSIVNIDCTIVVRLVMHEEQQQNTTLVGVLIKYIPNYIIAEHKHLLFRPINKDHAYLFHVTPEDGRIYVIKRIDREELCPYNEFNYHQHHFVEIPSNVQIQQQTILNLYNASYLHDCRLTFGVSLIKIINNIIDIIEVIRVHITVNDIDDNYCTFTPDSKQTIYLPEDIKPHSHINIPLHQPLDLDAHPNHTVSSDKIFLYTKNKTTETYQSAAFQSRELDLPFNLIILPTGSLIKPYLLNLYITKALDYETLAEYHLIIEANSKYGKSSQRCYLELNIIVQDRNDYKPYFTTNYTEINIAENFNTALPIYTFSAIDLDMGDVYSKIIYELDSKASDLIKTTFFINPNNGSVYLKSKLNHRSHSIYTIPIIARNPFSYEVNVSKESIKSQSNEDNSVSFNPKQIETDSFSTAKLVVKVIDVNDNSPVITFQSLDGNTTLSIPEHSKNLPLDFAIISVTDDDDGLNGRISCFLKEKYRDQFKLTSIITNNNLETLTGVANSGIANNQGDEINLEKRMWSQSEMIYKLSASVSFDREQVDYIKLIVECHDHGKPPLMSNKVLYVEITDKNDHKPMFNSSELQLAITEDSDPKRKQMHYEVVKLLATDNDTGINAIIKYYIVDDHKIANHFHINELTGLIQSKGNLDREICDRYEFTVVARDCGLPALSNSINIQIIIRDYNDEQPTFAKQVYEFHMTENNPVDQYIGSITCSDNDLGSNGLIHFEIELMPYNRHTHHASELSLSLSSLSKAANTANGHLVNISTKLYLPFELLSYYDTQKSIYLVKIYTKGKVDREKLKEISEIQKTSTSSKSSLTSTLSHKSYGMKTKTSKMIDKTDIVAYKFWIVGEDQGQPQQRGRSLIHIIVEDENDNEPYFVLPKEDHTVIELSYLEIVRYPIIKLLAIDNDAGINGTVRYEIHQITREIIKNNDQIKTIKDSFSMNQSVKNYEFLKNSLFTLNPLNGLLRLNTQFSQSDVDKMINIQIKAYDLGIPISKYSYITIHIKPVNITPSETKNGFDYELDDDYDVDHMEDWESDHLTYSNWSNHNRLSLNNYIILSTVVVSILLSIILMCSVACIIKYRKLKNNSVNHNLKDTNGLDEIKGDYPFSEDGFQNIKMSPIRTKFIHDDNIHNIDSLLPNLISEIPNNSITSCNITPTVNYATLQYNTSLSQYVNNHHHETTNSTLSSYSSTIQPTVLPQPLIVRLEPISTNLLANNCVQPISILYSTNSKEQIDLNSVNPFSTTCYPSTSYTNHSYNDNKFIDVTNEKFEDLHLVYDQTIRKLSYFNDENVLNKHNDYEWNSLTKSTLPELQQLCIHSQPSKRNSLTSLGQDSGNGDSLETTTMSFIPITQSIWLNNTMNDIYDKQPVNLSLVHVYTPLSSVKEIDCNNGNISTSNSLTITTTIATTTTPNISNTTTPENTVKYIH